MFTIVAEDFNNCLSVTDSTSTRKNAADMNCTICHLNRTCVPYPQEHLGKACYRVKAESVFLLLLPTLSLIA